MSAFPYKPTAECFVFSHSAVALWLCPSVVWTHLLSFCCAVALQRDASVHSINFLFHSTLVLKLNISSNLPPHALDVCLGATIYTAQQHHGVQGICHYEVFATWSHCKIHVCTCGCHTGISHLPSLLFCVHKGGTGTVTTVKVAGMSSCTSQSCGGICSLYLWG